jgi:hypothetical protein
LPDFAPTEREREDRDIVIRPAERIGERDRAAFRTAAKSTEALDIGVRDELEAAQQAREVRILNGLELLEERAPVGSGVEPVLPLGDELLFDRLREVPKRN